MDLVERLAYPKCEVCGYTRRQSTTSTGAAFPDPLECDTTLAIPFGLSLDFPFVRECFASFTTFSGVSFVPSTALVTDSVSGIASPRRSFQVDSGMYETSEMYAMLRLKMKPRE